MHRITTGTIVKGLQVLAAGFVALSSVGCNHSAAYEYYRQVVVADDHTIHPESRLGIGTVPTTRSAYYRLARDPRGHLTDIEYFVQSKLAKDPVLGVARVTIQDLGGLQIVSFHDAGRRETMSHDGVYSIAVRYSGGKVVSVVNYDKNWSIIKCKHGLAAISWKYDRSGRRTTQKNYGSDWQPTEDTDGVTTIHWTYPPQIDHDLLDYINSKALHFEKSGPWLLIRPRRATLKPYSESDTVLREEFDKEDRRIQRAFLDPAGKLRKDANGVALVRWTHDVLGNIVEQSHFGPEGLLSNDHDGISIIRWKYDGNQRTERRFFDADGKLIEDAQTGVAITRWVYTDGQKLEESYFDSQGKKKEDLICGIATTRWKYWREKDSDRWSLYKEYGEENYYNANGKRTERKDFGIASITWADKGFHELWSDGKYTRIKEWCFRGKDGSLKAVKNKPYEQIPLAIEQWVYSPLGGKRRYLLGVNGAKLIED